MKDKLVFSIKQKEAQLAKLRQHIDKSSVCDDLYNKMLIEKAILVKRLKDLKENTLINRIKVALPHRNKLICDYFKK